MMTRPLRLLLVFLMFFQVVSSQKTDMRNTVDTILGNFYKWQDSIIQAKDPLNENMNILRSVRILKFEEALIELKEFEEEQRKYSGEISFGLNSLEGEKNNLFVINSRVALSNGTYPFDFNLSSNVLAQLQNGTLEESVSNLAISFDYNFSEKNLGQEAYVFVNGSNNSFLGIDQRYEIGGGLSLALGSFRKNFAFDMPQR